jgi:hypothetical protein
MSCVDCDFCPSREAIPIELHSRREELLAVQPSIDVWKAICCNCMRKMIAQEKTDGIKRGSDSR